MEIQIILTVKGEAPSVEAMSKAIYKVIDEKVTANKALITSYQAIEIRPNSLFTIQFPDT